MPKLRYLLYEYTRPEGPTILEPDARRFTGLRGVLLQSTDKARKSKNQFIARLQATNTSMVVTAAAK